MDRLNSLKEELRQMEEAYSKGQLNQNEISYMSRLKAEVERSEKALIEERVETLYQEDEWVIEHSRQLEEMKVELERLENACRLKRASVERNGLLFDSDLEELERQRDNLANNIDKLSQELDSRKDRIRDAIANAIEKGEPELEPEIEPDEIETAEEESFHSATVPTDSELDDINKNIGDINKNKKEKDSINNSTNFDYDQSTNYNKNYSNINNSVNFDYDQSTNYNKNYEGLGSRPSTFTPRLPAEEEPIGILPPAEGPIGMLPPAEEPIGLLPPAQEIIPDSVEPIPEEPIPDPDKPKPEDPDKPKPEDPDKPKPEDPDKPKPEDPTPDPDDPTPDPDDPIQEPDDKKETHEKRSFETIINGLLAGEEVLGLKDSDYDHFQDSNIKITMAAVKSELCGDGPLAYVAARFPKMISHAITGIVALGKKISGTLLSTKASRDKIRIIQERIDNLSEEDLETIREEFKGSNIVQADLPRFMNSLLLNKIREMNNRDIAALSSEVDQIASELYEKSSRINEINELRESGRITEEDAERRIKIVSEGSAELIRQYREKNQRIIDLSSHGVEEDVRATNSKMNYAGRIASKRPKEITTELQEAWKETSSYEQQTMNAIQAQDDLTALRGFIDYKNALQRQTAHKKSILFGERSVGLREATPIARQLDYREDPLLRDLTSSVMQVVAIANIANSVAVEMKQQQMVRDHNAAIAQHNADIDRAGQTVHESGDRLVAHEGAYGRGMQAQAMQRMEAQNTTHEQGLLRELSGKDGDWVSAMTDPRYSQMDHDINHVFDGQVYKGLRDQFTQASSDLSTGVISPQQYLSQIRDISNGFTTASQQEFQHALDVAQQYASGHPGFDLTAYQGSLDYTVSHLQDIIDMNDAMVESVDIGRVLQSLPFEHAQTLGQLPSSLLSNIVTSAVLSKAAVEVAKQTERVVGKAKEAGIVSTINESVRTQDKDKLIQAAEERYYGMSKLRQVLSAMTWRHIQELKKVTELTQEDVDTIKGAFR